jgi:transcriptional regulator with XRE-family HTH domain
MTQAPSVRHMLVGSMLRSYREAAGYKLDDAARILECDKSKISRVETGQRGIRPKELRELLTEYDVADAAQDALTVLARPRDVNAWWRDYRRLLPDAYLDFAVTEGVASRILVYAPLQVPELLWTPEWICPAAGEGSILQFSELSDVGLVHVAGPQGGVCLTTPSIVDAYTTIFQRMTSLSLEPEQSTLRLRRVARC